MTGPSSVATSTRRRNAYGPHDPATAPRTVTVLGVERWPQEHEEPVPVLLLRQRAQINAQAHRAGRGDWQSVDYLEAIARD